jgi:hypothetical protein
MSIPTSPVAGSNSSSLPVVSEGNGDMPENSDTAATEKTFPSITYSELEEMKDESTINKTFDFCFGDEKGLSKSWTAMAVEIVLKSPAFKKILQDWRIKSNETKENNYAKIIKQFEELEDKNRDWGANPRDEDGELIIPGIPLLTLGGLDQVIKAVLADWRADGTFENRRLKAAIYWLQNDEDGSCKTVTDANLTQEKEKYSDEKIRQAEGKVDANLTPLATMSVLIYQYALLEGFGPINSFVSRLNVLTAQSDEPQESAQDIEYV